MAKWRTGKKLGRTLYRDGVCVGMVDSSLVAEEIVVGLNACDEVVAAVARFVAVQEGWLHADELPVKVPADWAEAYIALHAIRELAIRRGTT